MKKEVERLSDKKIIVYTPIPYTVDTDIQNEKEIDNTVHRLKQDVKFLRECLKVWGIGEKKAIEKKYTLNTYTGEQLRHIAWEKEISNEMFDVMFNKHKW